jgi:hypothetical protein
MSTTGEQDHYSTEQVVFRLFIVPLRLGRESLSPSLRKL